MNNVGIVDIFVFERKGGFIVRFLSLQTIWPIYKTDRGRMELEGVLVRPFKRAEVNALRVWRFCKRLRCTELEE